MAIRTIASMPFTFVNNCFEGASWKGRAVQLLGVLGVASLLVYAVNRFIRSHLKTQSQRPILKPISLNDFLGEDVMLIIFSRLDITGVGRCAKVCRQWNEITKHDSIWKPRALKNALGKRVWDNNIGTVEGEPRLKIDGRELSWKEVCQILKAPCRFAPGRVEQNQTLLLIPKTINCQQFTINYFKTLLKKASKPTCFNFISPEIAAQIENIPIEESYLVLVTNTIVEGTRGLPPQALRDLIDKRGEGQYRLPRAIEHIAFIILEYEDGRECGYGRNPMTFSRSIDTVEMQQWHYSVIVGGFAPAARGSPGGLHVAAVGNMALETCGSGAVCGSSKAIGT